MTDLGVSGAAVAPFKRDAFDFNDARVEVVHIYLKAKTVSFSHKIHESSAHCTPAQLINCLFKARNGLRRMKCKRNPLRQQGLPDLHMQGLQQRAANLLNTLDKSISSPVC